MVYHTLVVKNHNRDELSRCVSLLVDRDARLDWRVMLWNFYYFVTTCCYVWPLCFWTSPPMPYAIRFILLPYAYLSTLSLSPSLTSYAYSFRTRNFTGSMLTHLLLIYDFICSSAALLRIMLPLCYWLVTFCLASSSFHILSSNRMVRSSLT